MKNESIVEIAKQVLADQQREPEIRMVHENLRNKIRSVPRA